jgi:hypothetical protein
MRKWDRRMRKCPKRTRKWDKRMKKKNDEVVEGTEKESAGRHTTASESAA